MPSVVLQQVSSEFARKNARGTLDKPVGIKLYAKYMEPELLAALNAHSPDGTIRIWGAKAERHHQFVKMPARNSIVLFRHGNYIFAHGMIVETTHNERLAEKLWGRDSDGETWPLIFFLKRLVPIRKEAAKFNVDLLHRKATDNWQGMIALPLNDSKRLQDYFARELTG